MLATFRMLLGTTYSYPSTGISQQIIQHNLTHEHDMYAINQLAKVLENCMTMKHTIYANLPGK